MDTKTLKLNFILLCMLVVGFSLLSVTLNYPISYDYIGMGFFILLHLVSEVFAVELPKGGMVSFGFAVDIAAIIIFGPLIAVILSLAGVIGSLLTAKWSFRNFFLNVLLFTVTVSASGITYYLLGGGHQELTFSRDIIPLVISSSVYLLINASLLTAGISVVHGLNFKNTWQSNIKWALPSFIALAPLGYLLAFIYDSMNIAGALLLLIPLFLARFSFNQYVQTKRAHLSVVQALVKALEAKDPYTKGHSDRVAEYAEIISRRMGMSEDLIEELNQAARMHDIGKIGVPEGVLNKSGALSDSEFNLIQDHPQVGSNILKEVDFLTSIADIIRYHHEWFDGTKGYPKELSGEEIPIGARILMVADCFDAMTSNRPYRKALSVEEALDQLMRGSNSQFDPEIVRVFVEYIQEERIGDNVRSSWDWDNNRMA